MKQTTLEERMNTKFERLYRASDSMMVTKDENCHDAIFNFVKSELALRDQELLRKIEEMKTVLSVKVITSNKDAYLVEKITATIRNSALTDVSLVIKDKLSPSQITH